METRKGDLFFDIRADSLSLQSMDVIRSWVWRFKMKRFSRLRFGSAHNLEGSKGAYFRGSVCPKFDSKTIHHPHPLKRVKLTTN